MATQAGATFVHRVEHDAGEARRGECLDEGEVMRLVREHHADQARLGGQRFAQAA
jgi:hypothetical protein